MEGKKISLLSLRVLAYLGALLIAGLTAAGGLVGLTEGAVTSVNANGGVNGTLAVDLTDSTEGYSVVVYDNTNGLPTSEANAVAQTREGFIWIGSYSGLIRYDGSHFERVEGYAALSSVECL